MERRDCTGASTRAKGSAQILRDTETHPAGDDDGGGDLDALLGEVEVAIRASKGQKTGGKRRPRSLREVRAVLQGIRDGTLLVEPVRADEPGSRRRGRWADESQVKNRPAWAKARIQSAMGRHFKVTGIGTPARLVWWHLWSRGSGVLTDSTGRSVVEVGMVHAKWLAEETGLGERTVRRALVELEEAGMIARRRTFRGFKYRVLVPAALIAEIAGMSGQSGPSGQDMSLASGQDMSLASGQRVSLDTSDLLSDPPFRGGDEREDLNADQRATLGGVAADREESEGGGRAVVADPMAVLRAMLVGAGVYEPVAEKLVAAPTIASMSPADLAAQIEAASVSCGGAKHAGGVLVKNLRRIAARGALRPKDSRGSRDAKPRQTRSTDATRPRGDADSDPIVAAALEAIEDYHANEADDNDRMEPLWCQVGADLLWFSEDGVEELRAMLHNGEVADHLKPWCDRSAVGIRYYKAASDAVKAVCARAVEIAVEAGEEWGQVAERLNAQLEQLKPLVHSDDREVVARAVQTMNGIFARAGEWVRDRWPAPPEEPPATREQRAAIRAQVEATMKKPAVPIEPIADTRRRCPSDVRPRGFLLHKDRRVREAIEEAAKAAGTWSHVVMYAPPHKVEIEPGCDLDEVVARAVESQPDAELVEQLIDKWEGAVRADKHERKVVLAVLVAIRDELARRRRLEPPTRNPVEVLRALQATGDPPIARIADGEVVEAGENVITTTPKRKRSRTA